MSLLKAALLFLTAINVVSVIGLSLPNIRYYSMSECIKEQQLPKAVKPSHYKLHLYPKIKEQIFEGNVSIIIKIEESTNTITLHADENLKITEEEVILTYLGNEITTGPEITGISRNSTTEKMTITLKEELQKGASYELKLSFSGVLEGLFSARPYSKMRRGKVAANYGRGYSSRYGGHGGYGGGGAAAHYVKAMKPGGLQGGNFQNHNLGKESLFAVTDVFPTRARSVFPCFDEPSYKAKFDIVVSHLKNMIALSVMPSNYTEIDAVNEGYVLEHFATTPPISTFSVGVFMSSDMSCNETVNIENSEGGYKMQIFYSNQTYNYETIKNFTKMVPKVMKYLENYFGVPYPLPEINIVLTPSYPLVQQFDSFGLVVLPDYLAYSVTGEYVYNLVNQWLSHMITPQWWSHFNVTKHFSTLNRRCF